MATEEKDIQKKPAQNPVETERTRSRKVFLPKVDIYETKDSIVLIADMPGVDENRVDMMLEKNILTISGAVDPEAFPGYGAAYAEYDVGDYQRAFTISDEVDRDRIDARIRNGVLRVTLHKAEEVKARKIAIKAE